MVFLCSSVKELLCCTSYFQAKALPLSLPLTNAASILFNYNVAAAAAACCNRFTQRVTDRGHKLVGEGGYLFSLINAAAISKYSEFVFLLVKYIIIKHFLLYFRLYRPPLRGCIPQKIQNV